MMIAPEAEQRDREFADSPLEESGFELAVPLEGVVSPADGNRCGASERPQKFRDPPVPASSAEWRFEDIVTVPKAKPPHTAPQ
jgi:hypothetical protein